MPPFLVVHASWYAPWGLLTPAAWVALHARRYMDAYGVTNEDFAPVEVVDRAHAARNPDAGFYGRPITSRTTKHRAGSSSPCSVSSIAARRATGELPSS